jgi:NhaP-type Na+/H+ or K+/H+ antiporter
LANFGFFGCAQQWQVSEVSHVMNKSCILIYVLSHVGVTYEVGFWIGFIAPYTLTPWHYWQNSAITILLFYTLFIIAHALGFSAFTNHVQATDL